MKLFKIFTYFSFFLLLFSFLFTISDEMNQDLGRHLKIAEITLQSHTVISTNFFSYTNPSFPFINHHWFSEIIFYLSSQLFGLNILIILKTLCIMLAVYISMHAMGKGRAISTIISGFVFSFILLERSYIRPEFFGYVFFTILLYILFTYPKKQKLLYLIPLIMILWVNMHITFIFGLFLLGMLLIKNIYLSLDENPKFKWQILNFNYSNKTIKSDRWHVQRDSQLPAAYREQVGRKDGIESVANWFKSNKINFFWILSGFLVTLINPFFLKGALYPFMIFGNYGYTIVENQNLFFLSSRISDPFIPYFFILSPFIVASILVLCVKKKYIEGFVLSVFFILTIYQIRHMPFFVLTAIPTVGYALHILGKKIKSLDQYSDLLNLLLSLIMIFTALFFFEGSLFKTFHQTNRFGLQVTEDGKKATQFMKTHHLDNNMFNNFDVGGYAIYSLYPQYKIFVDNRPEAYPKDFLQQVYIPLQQNKALEKKIFQQYNIKTIFFAHTDQTPWAQSFIQSIYKDKKWKLIYVDNYIMILTTSSSLPDIRDNRNYFNNLIDTENNPLHLQYLARLFVLWGKEDLATSAFQKYQNLNQ